MGRLAVAASTAQAAAMDKKEFVIPAKIEGRRNKRAPLGESNRKPERRSSSTGPPAERAPPGTVRARYRVKCPYCAFPIAVPSDAGKHALPRSTTSWQRPIMLGTLFVFVLGGLLLYWGAR